MASTLHSRKQELVRNAIYDAAIALFWAKGFDETTVEEVANAAGVSRRSFFRYFASKHDLLAQNMLSYGKALAAAIAACPPGLSPLEVIGKAVIVGAKFSTSRPSTRPGIEISLRSASASQAYHSRFGEIEILLAEAFAARTKNASGLDIKTKMFAALTLLATNLTIWLWFTEESREVSTASRQVLANLTRVFGEQDRTPRVSKTGLNGRKLSGASSRRNARPLHE